MSVPIAVVGWIPKIRISSGVISEPPPMPVIPTRTPMPNPKRTIAGSMVFCAAPRGALIDFPYPLGRERGVRQDIRMRTEIDRVGASEATPPAGPHPADAGVSIRGLAHAYGELRTIGRLDLELEAGEVVGLVGPSGCGKSTLLELICGLREPTAGTIEVESAGGASERLARCAYMPQRDLLLPWYSALDNAALALRNHGLRKAAARRQAGALFERFGLAGFERKPPAELSGGMRQRVPFLRTLVAGKPVLALDAPFASLAAITRAEMQEWLAGAPSGGP